MIPSIGSLHAAASSLFQQLTFVSPSKRFSIYSPGWRIKVATKSFRRIRWNHQRYGPDGTSGPELTSGLDVEIPFKPRFLLLFILSNMILTAAKGKGLAIDHDNWSKKYNLQWGLPLISMQQ